MQTYILRPFHLAHHQSQYEWDKLYCIPIQVLQVGHSIALFVEGWNRKSDNRNSNRGTICMFHLIKISFIIQECRCFKKGLDTTRVGK